MRAVYLLLIGDKNYAQWTVNLAASVKFCSPEMHIVLLHEPGMKASIPQNEIHLFNEFIAIDPAYCYDGNKLTPGVCKLNLYQYFHHVENLYIDVDSLLLKDINGLFDQNKDKIIGCDTLWQGNQDSESWNCHWAQLSEVKTYYKLPAAYKIFESNSSYIYSKKNKEAESFWNQAKQNVIPEYKGKWGQSFPDELAFNIAFAQTGTDPSGQTAISWDSKLNNITHGLVALTAHYYILTYWGGKNNAHIGHYGNYDLWAGKVHRQILGKHNPYKYANLMRSKYIVTNRSQIPNRTVVNLPAPIVKEGPAKIAEYVKQKAIANVTIVGKENGVGLSKDKTILTNILTDYKVDFRDANKFHPLQNDNDICIFTEIVNPKYFGKYNILIPNQEWFETAWIKELKNFHAIWVKTKLAYNIFSSMHPNVKYIGFTSVDIFREVAKIKECFHGPGKSTDKGTEFLKGWESDLPKLNTVKNRLPDSQYLQLANKCLIHLCPSKMEGFGHYINEAKSMANVVITTDSAPMNELITDSRFLCKVKSASNKIRFLGTYTNTDYEEIQRVVRSIIDIDLIEVGRQNRVEFLKQDSEFKETFINEIKSI